jgi:hypothetical protein
MFLFSCLVDRLKGRLLANVLSEACHACRTPGWIAPIFFLEAIECALATFYHSCPALAHRCYFRIRLEHALISENSHVKT